MYEKRPLKVLIIGCGLGGLSCAISCLKEGLDVQIIEKSKEIKEVGAGIQVPPNGTRVLQHYNLVDKIKEAGGVSIVKHQLLRYSNGKVLCSRPDEEWNEKELGALWYVIHRADYHLVLLNEAKRRGAKIRLGCEITDIDFNAPYAITSEGEVLYADAIIGADGLRSMVRGQLLGYISQPEETGDLAYRATIPRSCLEKLNDPALKSLIEERGQWLWCGPNKHAVMYPVRNKTEFNLVLLSPDDLPSNVSTTEGDIQEMRNLFKGWDPRLTTLISCINKTLKWKICHMRELTSWTRGSVALLGDACHPTLPYQAQGAAMAVEDGLALGLLLGRLSNSQTIKDRKSKVPEILKVYERMRKTRTTVIVQGAVQNRKLFHMVDGPEQEKRDEELAKAGYCDEGSNCQGWADLRYLKGDLASDAERRFREWEEEALSNRRTR
jgi:salicylate hydroxylase